MTKFTKEIINYTLEDGIEFVKQKCKAKFDATIEVHFNLDVDVKKPEQTLRFNTTLPHGTGKTKKIAVFSTNKVNNADLELKEEDIEKIEKGKIKPKIDFDVLVAEPRLMSKLAKVAKILGPAGVMPNPKTGTVSDDVQKAVDLIKKGRMEVRTESNAPIVHAIIGKKSFSTQDLIENFNELYQAIIQNKPLKTKPDWIKSCYMSSTMSPSAKISL